MVIDDVMAPVWSEHDRDHMPAEILALLLLRLVLLPVLPQALALFLDLDQPYRHLRRSQREDRNWLKDRFVTASRLSRASPSSRGRSSPLTTACLAFRTATGSKEAMVPAIPRAVSRKTLPRNHPVDQSHAKGLGTLHPPAR